MRSGDSLRLGYLLDEFPSTSETFIANEIRGLQECGAEVTVFALRQGRSERLVDCPVVYAHARTGHPRESALPTRAAAAWEAVKLEFPSLSGVGRALAETDAVVQFSRLLRQRAIPHLHAHFASLPTSVALLVARLEPVSVSFSAHAWDIYCGLRHFPRKLRRSRLCITCTEANRRHLASLVGEQDRRKIVRIYHGVDLQRFPFRPRRQASAAPRILAVGRLVEKKGFPLLLEACGRLKGKLHFCCEIIGEGPLEGLLRTAAARRGAGDVMTFSGALAHRAMPQAYERADVLAVPSVIAPNGDRDGLPNVILEAMASGLPVVASRLSGIPEAVEDARTGLLCPPGDSAALADAIYRILTDSALRAACAAQARKLVEEKFDASTCGRQVFEAVRSAARA